MTRDIPIIFSAPMIRALIEGRKTMTRRIAWRDAKFGLQDYASEQLEDMELRGWDVVGEGNDGLFRVYKPTPWQRVKAGDRLWVRENFSGPHEWEAIPPAGWGWDTMVRPPLWYWADGNPDDGDWTRPKPSIHMPRYASRLTLIVTATKIEPLQDISLIDVWSEGCEVRQFWLFGADGPERQKIGARVFGNLWEELHGRESWDANPPVVALTFRVVKANIDSEDAR